MDSQHAALLDTLRDVRSSLREVVDWLEDLIALGDNRVTTHLTPPCPHCGRSEPVTIDGDWRGKVERALTAARRLLAETELLAGPWGRIATTPEDCS